MKRYGDTLEHKGHTFLVETPYDEDMREPWKENDGHGEVSDWTRRDKAPGERILSSDRGSNRFYDFAGAVQLARKDGWGCKHSRHIELGDGKVVYWSGHTSPGKTAACAAECDFDYLRRWCNDDWHYVNVHVSLMEEDEDGDMVETGEDEWLGGVEDGDSKYLDEVARELADQILARVEVDEPNVQLSEN